MDSFKAFVDKWATPTMFTVLLGGIIWGVQLNFAVLKLTEQMASQNASIIDLKTEYRTTAILNARTSAILDGLTQQIKALEQRMTRNEGNIADNLRESHGHGAGE